MATPSQNKVYSTLDQVLASWGFTRTSGVWWTRERGVILQRIHIHKFTFTTAFRVHSAIHPAAGEGDWVELNGIASRDGYAVRYLLGLSMLPYRRYDFTYVDEEESMRHCAGQIAAYIKDIALPWFERWNDVQQLLSSPKSPLSNDAKQALRQLMNS